jgi:transposase-like protein
VNNSDYHGLVMPNLVRRTDGGWLAVAPPGSLLSIAVTAFTEVEAQEKLCSVYNRWIEIRDDSEPENTLRTQNSKLPLFHRKETVVMAHPVLDQRHFHDENAAYGYVEARIWPNGPLCPHCGGVDRIGKLKGKSTRIGVYKCFQCRKPFRATVGTVFEASHIPLRLWLQAIHLMSSSKKGISSNQLHRVLGVTLKSAWFMSHRIREVMRSFNLEPMGGAGAIVESDETYIGRLEGVPNSAREVRIRTSF